MEGRHLVLQLDLTTYLNNVMTRVGSKTQIDQSEKIIVYAPEFMSNLTAVVTEKLKTPGGKK